MKTRGFTLIELLVVISIIGVLATIVLSSLSQAREKGKNARYFVEVKQLQTALELYHVDNGEYPQVSAYFSHNTNAAPANTFIAEMEPYFDVQAFIDDLLVMLWVYALMLGAFLMLLIMEIFAEEVLIGIILDTKP